MIKTLLLQRLDGILFERAVQTIFCWVFEVLFKFVLHQKLIQKVKSILKAPK
jgi:hypothetical protein